MWIKYTWKVDLIKTYDNRHFGYYHKQLFYLGREQYYYETWLAGN